MSYDPHAECPAYNHPWKRVGPIIVVTTRKGVTACKVALQCQRCKSWRYDLRQRVSGGIAGRTYAQSTGYKAYLAEHNRVDAWKEILSDVKEQKDAHGTDDLSVRPVQKARRTRRHHRAA